MLRRLRRRLGLLGAAARLVATWPLGPVGLGARHIRAIRYAKFRQAVRKYWAMGLYGAAMFAALEV